MVNTLQANITTLGNVAKYINGRAFKPSEWEETGLPIIRIQNLTDKKAKYNYTSLKHDDKFLVKNGDLLFAWSASLGAHIWQGNEAWLNQHIFKVLPYECIEKSYLYYFLCRVVSELYTKTHGSGMVHITKNMFINTPIPVPPIQDQKRIVARIEELFSNLDSAVETLQKTKHQLEVYRQAVLREAFADCDTEVCLNEVCRHITDGDHMPPPKEEKGIPFIMISNIQNNIINWDNTAYVGEDYFSKINEKRTPKKGDVLYTVTGSFGIPVIIDFEKPFCFQRHIALLRPNDRILQKYLFYVLQSPQVYQQAKDKSTGTSQKTVGLNVLRKIEIPFVDNKSLQNDIVTALESKLTICDSIKQTIDQSLQQAEAMRQSILKQAFEGGLYEKIE